MIPWFVMDQGVIELPRVRSQRGFTLIELMVIVVILGILAATIVPGWFRTSAKAKAKTEVTGMFAEIGVKEEQYKIEKQAYLAAATCPATPTNAGVDWGTACLTGSSTWDDLRIAPTEKKLGCTYAITVGAAGSTPVAPSGFTMTKPVNGWWWALATCDADGKTGSYSTFFTSSVDTKLQIQNEGS